jgi:hypothetical protein
MTAYHHSIYCDLIHNEDATNQNNFYTLFVMMCPPQKKQKTKKKIYALPGTQMELGTKKNPP